MEEGNNNSQKRPYIGIWFDCCGTYGRIYKNKDGTYYTGHCPRCMKSVRVRIGTDGEGTDRRFFRGR